MPERSDLPSPHDVAAPSEYAAAWIPPAAGACRAEDMSLFLGMPGEPAVARIAREEEAKRICARCAVLIECRSDALAAIEPEPTGVRGGLTPDERKAVARRRRRRGSPRAR